ncbi:MAG: hypothetical protein D8M59_06075 [Planctomycetes bacterium]|nr:hypothetical protein [Planctomycetota bacterium]NOG55063.1 hypothetical protein [Planctomycetota bacterium]
MSIGKTLFRTALIGTLAVGGLTLIVGPQRMATGAAQARYTLVSWFDSNVEDPVIIRQQLKKLQEQYPERIRELRKALTAVDGDIAATQREIEVASKVVTMAKADLGTLAGLVDEAQVTLAADTGGRDVLVKFQGRHLSVEQAYARANRIKQAAVNYQDRQGQGEHELTLLQNQRKRLSDQLGKLESEYSAFQAQVWQIERQLAAIERDKELIEMMEDREEVLDNNGHFQINSLDALNARLESVRNEHAAILESFNDQLTEDDYVSVAQGRIILEGMNDPFDWSDIEDAAPALDDFPQAPIVIDGVTHDTMASLPNADQ